MSTDIEKNAVSTSRSICVDNDPNNHASLNSKNGGDVQTVQIDKAVERSYLRKLDFHLLPFLSVMYLFNSVDRVGCINSTNHFTCQLRNLSHLNLF